MELEAVIAQCPVVSDLGVLLGHDVGDADSLEACGKGHCCIAGAQDQDIRVQLASPIERLGGSMEKLFILGVKIKTRKPGVENPNLPFDFIIGSFGWQQNNLAGAGSCGG